MLFTHCRKEVKRGKIFSYLTGISADVMFLQETHLKDVAHTKLRCSWVGQTFHSSFSTKTRGVAILFRKNVPFKHTDTIVDHQGRFLIVTGELYSSPVTLLNIYGPNFDSPGFYSKILSRLPVSAPQSNLIIGGDLNCVLDPYLDKSSQQKLKKTKTAELITSFMNNSKLVDIWRVINPTLT